MILQRQLLWQHTLKVKDKLFFFSFAFVVIIIVAVASSGEGYVGFKALPCLGDTTGVGGVFFLIIIFSSF